MINNQAKLYCLSPSTVAFQAESTERGLKRFATGKGIYNRRQNELRHFAQKLGIFTFYELQKEEI